jgi:type I restriction enzyme M protein
VNKRQITQGELEAYLWGAANLLRGSIDAGEYKNYIFPLLFLKRLSDVYDEEYEEALAASGQDKEFAQLPEQHRFQIPAGAHWSDIRAKHTEVGKAIQSAMREVEKSNPRLEGVFGDAQWSNTNKLSNTLLRNLIEHFSMFELRVANLPEDELGQGYEYLVKKFADDSGHTAQEFYTNRTVVHLMTEMLEIKSGESVYDPTCGTGGMLLSAARYLLLKNQEHRNLRLYGQERNVTTSSIARMNLFLHGIEDFEIAQADTLEDPHFIESGHLKAFDVVLANPPYSISQWDRAAWASDKWGRNKYGTPPQGRADYAFIQHIVESMDPKTGRCAILLPHGVLFRNEEYAIRKAMIEADVIEGVIGLAANLFYNSPMEACILVCRRHKDAKHKNKIVFIDALEEVSRVRAQSLLSDGHQSRIANAYLKFKDDPGFASVKSLSEVAEQEFNLSIPLYVKRRIDDGAPSLPEALENWKSSSEQLSKMLMELLPMLESLKDSR